MEQAVELSQAVAKYSHWNLGESVVTKRHHNWCKIFGEKKITLAEATSYVERAVQKGSWKVAKETIRGKGGEVIGKGLEIVAEVDGHTIWVEALKKPSGQIIVKNAGVR